MRDAPSHANDCAAKFIQALDGEREGAGGKVRSLVACVQVHIIHGYPCQDRQLLTASLSGSPTRLVQGSQRRKQFAMPNRAME